MEYVGVTLVQSCLEPQPEKCHRGGGWQGNMEKERDSESKVSGCETLTFPRKFLLHAPRQKAPSSSLLR